MAKTLCEWSKHEILEDIGKLMQIVCDPQFVCRKCARAAHREKHLCKPVPLPLKHEPPLGHHDDEDDE